MLIDDFDVFLHYESAMLLVKKLNECDGFQSVVVVKNTALTNNHLTRADCCYIISKEQIKESGKRTEKEIREVYSLGKIYMNGGFPERKSLTSMPEDDFVYLSSKKT